MEWYAAGLLMLGMAMGLIFLGLPVAIAFLSANAVGAWIFLGGVGGLEQIVSNATRSISNFRLVPVPMFILMGALFYHSGLAVKVFDALDALFGRIPGRLCYVTVAGGTIFATLSGSSLANTAMMGSLLVPDMLDRGYKKHMAMGPILGSAGIAIFIPPSTLAVLLGSLADINIGALLIAGVIPGLILAALYTVMIFTLTRIDPESAPIYDVARIPMGARLLIVLTNIVPMGLVFFFVVGFIIMGIATPEESAAFGVLGVLILAAAYRRLTWRAIKLSFAATLRVMVMVLMILLGSLTFSQIMAFSGATAGMVTWVTQFDLSPLLMLLSMYAVLLVLGMFVDAVSTMMLTLPIFIPIAAALGFDPIWFGIIILLSIEMSGTTPPFGLLLFIMMGVAPRGTTLGEVAWAAAPYLGCDFVLLVLLIVFPGIALYLPSLI